MEAITKVGRMGDNLGGENFGVWSLKHPFSWQKIKMPLCHCAARHSDSDGDWGYPSSSGIKVFLHWSNGGDQYVTYNQGTMTAEEICIHIAQKVGEWGLK
ncbi:non-receptor tyrosine-protein kinase TYK2 [Vombatus ursinus]|uniref:non-receptor tyrosine-protein kinase TYK2 n=1 Tax=Vombatus ursinus TaxID=29139 RepID=UPI000FFD1B9A|nr:non-receptor tyrosine-protein kinase TYK2 [Vombatus ursinus]